MKIRRWKEKLSIMMVGPISRDQYVWCLLSIKILNLTNNSIFKFGYLDNFGGWSIWSIRFQTLLVNNETVFWHLEVYPVVKSIQYERSYRLYRWTRHETMFSKNVTQIVLWERSSHARGGRPDSSLQTGEEIKGIARKCIVSYYWDKHTSVFSSSYFQYEGTNIVWFFQFFFMFTIWRHKKEKSLKHGRYGIWHLERSANWWILMPFHKKYLRDSNEVYHYNLDRWWWWKWWWQGCQCLWL